MESIVSIVRDSLCLVWVALTNPLGFINKFIFIPFIDLVSSVLPDHPAWLTVGSLLSGISSALPLSGSAEVMQILQGIIGMFSIYIVVKIWKLLPFT